MMKHVSVAMDISRRRDGARQRRRGHLLSSVMEHSNVAMDAMAVMEHDSVAMGISLRCDGERQCHHGHLHEVVALEHIDAVIPNWITLKCVVIELSFR
jgi:hypothetical protein